MELITQRHLIRAVAKRWRTQYAPFSNDNSPLFSERNSLAKSLTKKEISELLDGLNGDTATPAEVANIIGNESWTQLTCNECKQDVEAVIRVGDEPDYDSHTVELCRDCAAKAAQVIVDAFARVG